MTPDKLLSNDKSAKMMSGNLYNKWNLWTSTMEKRKNWTSTVLNNNCARNISVEIWCFGKDNVIKDFYKRKKKKKERRLQNWEGNFLDNTTSIHFCFWLTHWEISLWSQKIQMIWISGYLISAQKILLSMYQI